MTIPITRRTLLLAALGVVSIAAVRGWMADDREPAPLTAAPAATSAAPTVVASHVVDTLSDSDYAARVAGFGVMLGLRGPGEGDSASFYFVARDDSSVALRDLGFYPASALLEDSSRFERLGNVDGPSPLLVASRQPVDSALHVIEDGCIPEITVPVRPLAPGRSAGLWTLALRPGAGREVQMDLRDGDSVPRPERDSALALVNALVVDSATRARDMPGGDSALAGAPFRLATLRRLTIDGAELLIVDASRDDGQPAREASSPGSASQYSEQRLLIAERDAGDHASPFRVAWFHRDLSSVDEASTLAPSLLLHLGPARLLTLYLTADYEDGAGGVFVSRTAPGRWTRIASWYGGC